MRRVVITGAGAITPLGQTYAQTYRAMQRGDSAIGPLEIEDLERLSIKIGAQIHGFDPCEHLPKSKLTLYDRATQFALVAAQEAMRHAGVNTLPYSPERVGVILGTSGGGLTTQNENYRAVYQEHKKRVHPFIVPKLMHNAASSHIAMDWGVHGPSYTVSTACASSNHAIGQAFHMVRHNMTDMMIAGGSEAMLCFGGLKAWEGLRVMSTSGCRPFCASRDGFVQGEGAAIFTLESYDHATERGAPILCEIKGFAMGSDAHDILKPSQEGAARTMRTALKDAALSTSDIGYINAHGTGTRLNDLTEIAAIREVFGAAAADISISSTKSMHGHLIGAAGAIELIACISALQDGCIPPTVGHRTADPDCALDITANTPRMRPDVSASLSNAFAFGGLNAVLALSTL